MYFARECIQYKLQTQETLPVFLIEYRFFSEISIR